MILPKSYKNTKTPVTTFCWLSCKRDFNCLKMSVESAMLVMGTHGRYFVVEDEQNPFSAAQLSQLTDLGCEFLPNLKHKYVWGLTAMHRLVAVYKALLNITGTAYITKIDSDVIMFDNKFENVLARNIHPFVGTYASFGVWGQFQHHRADTINWLASLTAEEFSKRCKKYANRPEAIVDDETIPRVIASKFIPDFDLSKWSHPGNLYPFCLQMPDVPIGFFGMYHPANQADKPTNYIGYVDCVEFGRRAEYTCSAENVVKQIEIDMRCALNAVKSELH